MHYTESPAGDIMVTDTPPVYTHQPTAVEIIKVVQMIYELSDIVTNTSRVRPYPEARFLMYRLLWREAKMTKSAIARIFNLDHTTILWGIHKCAALYDTDDVYRAKVILAERQVMRR